MSLPPRSDCSPIGAPDYITVAAGILPAVEPGVSPGGIAAHIAHTSSTPYVGPGGKMPPSTAGRMPAATCWRRHDAHSVPGFTLIDLLVLVAFLSVVAAIIVARGVAVKQGTRLARCTANLQQVDRAILTFAEEHGQTLPGAVADVPGNLWWWYKEQVKGYLGLKGPSAASDAVFACPEDRGYSEPVPFHLNPRFDYGSYVFNGVTLGGLPNIAGWKLASVNRPKQTLLVMEWTAHAPLSWHKSKTGKNNMPFYRDAQSVVGFVDGHVSFSKIYYDGYNAAYTQDPIAGYDYQYSGN